MICKLIRRIRNRPRYRYRSAVTGQYVGYAYALLHPRETVRERVPETEREGHKDDAWQDDLVQGQGE